MSSCIYQQAKGRKAEYHLQRLKWKKRGAGGTGPIAVVMVVVHIRATYGDHAKNKRSVQKIKRVWTLRITK